MLAACKDRFISKKPLLRVCHQTYLTSRNCIPISLSGVELNSEEIVSKLHFCTEFHSVKCLHALLITFGKAQSVHTGTRILNAYARVGNVSFARSSFDQIEKKNTYTWNSLISAYIRNCRLCEALRCVYQMLSSHDARPDFYTFPPILKTCRNVSDGTKIHCLVSKLGLEWDVFIAASLVHMYCRFDVFDCAIMIFNDMPFRDMGCWNAAISGFCQKGNAVGALSILQKMRSVGVKMDGITLATVLPICVQQNDIRCGMLIHAYALKHGLDWEIYVSNALINMYAKFGELGHAEKIFNQMAAKDLITWNSMVAAYEQNDHPNKAIECFSVMQLNGFQPDLLSLVSLTSSIAQTKIFRYSTSIHGFILRRCWIPEDVVLGNTVVDMYAKMGYVDYALEVFNKIPCKDVISWNTIIAGYAQNGLASEAIEAYCMMRECEGIPPNQGTWVSILPAYAHLGSLREGMKSHGQVFKVCLHLDVFVGTCLIDLYGKCGRLNDAMSLFYEIPRESSVPWNSMISCQGVHGHGLASIQLFRNMLDDGVKPDSVTFLSLLASCSHSGLVDEGKQYFDLMQQKFRIKPSIRHYGCMVDLFARAGQLETAYNFITKMPLQPDASVWGALLSACRVYGNVELGKLASDNLFSVNSEDVGYYILLSNIYANSGKWERVDEVRSLARDRGLRKTPGWSSVEISNKIEVFYTGNQYHPQYKKIYDELEMLTAKMKSLGYTPDFSFVLQDVEDDEKEHILANHSERLAVVYGLLNTPPKSSVCIFKNLRVCGDCHNVTKFMSIITEREIVVRDSNRFHHFKDGICSCGDHW
ncbi:hypothetical protein DM860_007862 [Cuscuta australis]|uniref:DYW domain-containing protein n=1 Tax=Cuscuta australis TaxID=267555 RepID=A0A328E096_9ASTE|nr:hypothetical protein DM860_007862 [Cuscuta australis]